jgi:hypothetical protein
MKPLLLLPLLALLSGCLATFDGKLENRIVCTVAGDALYALSEYGPVGISARISEKDRAVVCKAPAAPAPAAAASGAK